MLLIEFWIVRRGGDPFEGPFWADAEFYGPWLLNRG